MVTLNQKYITDSAGRRTDVIINYQDYRRLLVYLEDLEGRLEIRKRKRGAKFVSWETAKAGLKAKLN